MGFMHLWAIIGGVLALGVPLAVHWLTRPRPLRLNLSTLRFVQQAVKERRARHRLRDALILAARMVALACLALAFARPLMSAATIPTGSVDRVVILDVSASMGAVSGGVPAIEKARGVAARYLEQTAGLRANLILAGARPQGVFEHPSANLTALRDELGTAGARPERLDLAKALAAAGEMYLAPPAGSAAPRRELVIVSDLQRSNWGAADFSALPKDCVITIESVAPAQTAGNLAITSVAAHGAGGGRPATGLPGIVDVEVANDSAAPRNIGVEVDLGGRTYHLEKVVPANTRAQLTSEVAFTKPGIDVGEARITAAEDALAADNRRSFVVDVHAAPVYLLVSRDPADPRPTSSHFLERALAPEAGTAAANGRRQGERVVRITSAALDQQTVSEADAVVLDRPGRLDGSTVALLANWLRRGKSILYVASENVDANNLGSLVLQAGADLRMPVEFIPPASGGAAGASQRRDLKLADLRKTDAVWAIFGDALQQTVDTLRFTARLNSRPLDGGLADDLLASYSDRSACLVSTPCGQGTLIVWNADLAESNIVQSGAFVPLVGELASRLLASRPAAAAEGGEPLVLTLPPDMQQSAELSVETPGKDDAQKGQFVQEHGGLVWRLDAARYAGAYRIMHNGTLVAAAAVAVPADEADLSTISADTLKTRLAGERDITIHAAGIEDRGPDRGWVWFVVAASLALLCEVAFLRGFRT